MQNRDFPPPSPARAIVYLSETLALLAILMILNISERIQWRGNVRRMRLLRG
jgi:hypothetical protein